MSAPAGDMFEEFRATGLLKRRRDAVVAGHSQDPTVARRLLTDPSPAVRSSARRALARLQVLTHEELEAGLRDVDPAARRDAVTLAATRPDVDIVGLLTDLDPTVIEVTAWACGERPPTRQVVAALIVVAKHQDPLLREAAIAALGALGDPAALPVILAATKDKATVRRRAVLALAPFEGPEVDAALAQALLDRDWQVRQAGEDLR